MAPGFPGSCAYAVGADGTESYFYQDLDNDNAEDAGEFYPFTPMSRYEVRVFSGTGTAHCCVTDEHNITLVGDPDNVEDISVVDTSSVTDVGFGYCFSISDTDLPEVIMFDRGAAGGSGAIQGIYDTGLCGLGSVLSTASTAYSLSGTGPLYRACANSGDCAGITFNNSPNTCISSVSTRQKASAAFLMVCNYTASMELIACEKK